MTVRPSMPAIQSRKIGEEFVGWMTGPARHDAPQDGHGAGLAGMADHDQRQGILAARFTTPTPTAPAKYLANLGRVAEFLAESQLPTAQTSALSDLVKGDGDPTVNELLAFGPVAGVTFSKGAPGGPPVGELYHAREMHDHAVQAQLPDIRKHYLEGNHEAAQEARPRLACRAVCSVVLQDVGQSIDAARRPNAQGFLPISYAGTEAAAGKCPLVTGAQQ